MRIIWLVQMDDGVNSRSTQSLLEPSYLETRLYITNVFNVRRQITLQPDWWWCPSVMDITHTRGTVKPLSTTKFFYLLLCGMQMSLLRNTCTLVTPVGVKGSRFIVSATMARLWPLRTMIASGIRRGNEVTRVAGRASMPAGSCLIINLSSERWSIVNQ